MRVHKAGEADRRTREVGLSAEGVGTAAEQSREREVRAVAEAVALEAVGAESEEQRCCVAAAFDLSC